MNTDVSVLSTREIVHNNIARMLGVADYSELVKAGVVEEKAIVKKAEKRLGIKKLAVANYISRGNPYVMLGLKVNSKGKRVK